MANRVIRWVLLVAFGLAVRGAPAQEQLPKLNPDGLTPSATCGECHQAIHAVWQQSLHALSWSNGVFQAAFRRAVAAEGNPKARLCLSCHAPTVRHTRDYEVKTPITAEGISCDFCHSIRAVELSDPSDPMRLDVGHVKYGPLRHAQSPVHVVKESPLHRRSELCAACHQYRNANGVTVLGTYGEWKASAYGERGRQCQDCHMPLVPGRTVALRVKETASTSVNLHDISGSHDLEKVRQAITLKLKDTECLGDYLRVSLQVTNAGSGHCFPTGLPMHRAVLQVVLRERGREIDRREVRFEMVLLDKDGSRIRREHEVFLKAAQVDSDTRLRPLEARDIVVSFSDVKAPAVDIEASLFYEYSTETLRTEGAAERIEPIDMKFLIASVRDRIPRPAR